MVIEEDDYATVTSNAGFRYTKLVNPGEVDSTINDKTTPFQLQVLEAAHTIKIRVWRMADAVESIGMKRIVASIDAQYIEELKKPYIAYTNETMKSLIKHLRKEWCIITTGEKKLAKAGFYEPWDQENHIATFIRRLDEEQKKLKKVGITLNESEKVQHFVEQMYEADLFDDKEMMEWEATTSKSWPQAKIYFTKKYKSKQQYNKMVKAKEFGNISNIKEQKSTWKQETDAAWTEYTDGLEDSVAEQREKMANMADKNDAMINLTKELTSELKEQRRQNKEVMEQNAKLIALMAKGGRTIEDQPPHRDRGGRPQDDLEARKERKPCAHCGGRHKSDRCYTLDENKENIPSWWKEDWKPRK